MKRKPKAAAAVALDALELNTILVGLRILINFVDCFDARTITNQVETRALARRLQRIYGTLAD